MKNRLSGNKVALSMLGHRPPRPRRPRRKKKVIAKSNFVRFLESLQNRGPLTMDPTYVKWTTKVRADMEASGTWPKLKRKVNLAILAEYLSRLMREFWLSNHPIKWYLRGKSKQHNRPLKYKELLDRIFHKIRDKGRRDRSFFLWTDKHTWPTTRMYISIREFWGPVTHIRPYTEFCDHGAGI